jgi:hypothetical protein
LLAPLSRGALPRPAQIFLAGATTANRKPSSRILAVAAGATRSGRRVPLPLAPDHARTGPCRVQCWVALCQRLSHSRRYTLRLSNLCAVSPYPSPSPRMSLAEATRRVFHRSEVLLALRLLFFGQISAVPGTASAAGGNTRLQKCCLISRAAVPRPRCRTCVH